MGADPSSKLDRFEKALRERLAGAEAAAFLGHHPCPPQAKELLQAQLGRGVFAKSLRILFWKWPALTACWIAAHVRDRYGERDDHEFWPILNELFGHEIRAGERKSVAKLFQWACAKLDLARAVAGKHVDQFVVQAGAPVHQLDRFVRSCLELERAEGLPDPDDDPACLHFALAVAERLKPTNPRLARVLEADATAWYVRRWILLRSGSDDPADPDFVAELRDRSERVPERTSPFANPSLLWAEGGRFRCMPPTNLEPGASRHVLVAADGVALRRDQRYAEARLVFALETERIELRLPAPDPVAWVERRDPDGRPVTHLLDPAEPVVVQPGDPRILEIRCCEPEAELRFGNSRVRRPFRARPAYRCALLAAAEHCRSGDPTIAVRLPSGNELPLARLTVATEALAWRSLREPNDPPVEVLAFRLREPIETLWLYAEELIEGTRVELVLAPDGLDRTDPATGLEARLRQELGSPSFAYRLELPSRAWPGGPWLCRFEVGEDGSGDLGRTRRALSNARGDAFGWLIAPASASEREKRALDLAIGRAVTLFTRAHRALMRCWALPAWQDAGLAGLEHWWRGAARVIGSHPNREALIAALLPLAFEDPPADAAPSWIPILGLWHVFPDHWALPATYFSELEKSPEPAARRLARAAEPVRAGGLARALAGGLAIDQHHLGCFANLARASARLGDEELAGFDLTAWQGQLREARGTIGCEESAPLLAHAEFGAALEACRRRYDLVVASGGFEQHRPTAMTVVAAARRWLKREGSAFLRAAVPQLRGEFRGEFDLEEESGEALLAGLPWASLAVALACRLEPRRRGTLEKLFAALAEQAADRGRVFDGLQFVWDLARELFAFWLSFCEVLLVTGDHRA